jgi:hypothetical protein
MACVAFDLDETLGNFQTLWYLSYLWSVPDLNTIEQLGGEAPFRPSRSLQETLERVKRTFANYLFRDKSLLNLIIRPNINVLLNPLLEAKRTRHLKTIVLYSNTGVQYTVELAEYLLEQIFKTQNLFSVKADWWSPLRTADKVIIKGEQIMHKRIETLQKLFQKGLKTKKTIPLGNILFIDDRNPRHTLVQQVPEGLTYLVPTAFQPEIPAKQKEYMLFIAFSAMQQHGLLENEEYLNSKFCNRTIKVLYPHYTRLEVKSLPELFQRVTELVMSSGGKPWKSDSANLRKVVRDFLRQVKP